MAKDAIDITHNSRLASHKIIFQNSIYKEKIEKINPYVANGMGIFDNFFDLIINGYILYFSTRYKSVAYRRLLMISSSACLSLAMLGLGVSTTMLANTLGASIDNITYLPVVFSAAGFLLSVINMMKNIYIYSQENKLLKTAQHHYEAYLALETPSIKAKIEKIDKDIEDLLEESKRLIKEEKNKANKKRIQVETEEKISALKSEHATHYRLKDEYLKIKKSTRDAKHNLIFSIFDCGLAAVGLGLAIAGLCLGVPTLGLAPAIIAWVTVAISISVKIYQAVDKKTDYRCSSKLHALFSKGWRKITGAKEKSKSVSPHQQHSLFTHQPLRQTKKFAVALTPIH